MPAPINNLAQGDALLQDQYAGKKSKSVKKSAKKSAKKKGKGKKKAPPTNLIQKAMTPPGSPPC